MTRGPPSSAEIEGRAALAAPETTLIPSVRITDPPLHVACQTARSLAAQFSAVAMPRSVLALRHPRALCAGHDVAHADRRGGVRDAAGGEAREERLGHALAADRVEVVERLADERAHALARG